MILGFFFVRPIPLPRGENYLQVPDCAIDGPHNNSIDIPNDAFSHAVGVDEVLGRETIVYEHIDDSHASLLVAHDNHLHPVERAAHLEDEEGQEESAHEGPESLDLRLSPSRRSRRNRSVSMLARRRHQRQIIEIVHEVRGRSLLLNGEFWLLFSLLSLRESLEIHRVSLTHCD